MKRNVILLFAGLLTLIVNKSMATHVAGGDIEFRSLGKDSIHIILHIYRECSGIPINTSPMLTLNTVNCTPSSKANVTMTQTLVRPVKSLCSSQKSTCEGGVFPFGIEEHRFEVKVNLLTLMPNLPASCCWIKASYQECCRNLGVTNIQPVNYYLEAELNRCIQPYNNSPAFTKDPISVVCSGQPYVQNIGVIDTLDNDSLSFEFASPLFAPDSPATFNNPFTRTEPFSFLGFPNVNLPMPAGLHLNPSTGDLAFTPTGTQQPVLAIKITEWRKVNGVYTRIGAVSRDVQFYTYQCPPNNAPSIEINGSTNSPSSYNLCPGVTLCLFVKGRDVDSTVAKSDTTVIRWNHGIPSAAFTHVNAAANIKREDEGTFCWTPGANNARLLPYSFELRVDDNNCPISGSLAKTINIYVFGLPSGKVSTTSLGNNAYRFGIVSQNQVLPNQPLSYQWTLCTKPTGIYDTSGAFMSTDSAITSYTYPKTGKYVVRLRLSNNCNTIFLYDTVNVAQNLGFAEKATGQLKLFPNPATNSLSIETPTYDMYEICLFDVTGREVLCEKQDGKTLQIKRNGLAGGIYTLRVMGSQNQTYTGRVRFE